MTYTEAVNELTKRITSTLAELKADGTTGMSAANLMQVVSARGIHLANANTYTRAFAEALANAENK